MPDPIQTEMCLLARLKTKKYANLHVKYLPNLSGLKGSSLLTSAFTIQSREVMWHNIFSIATGVAALVLTREK